MKVIVLGGYGAVGSQAVAYLREMAAHVLAAGRDPKRADLLIDAGHPHGLDRVLKDVDVVLNCAGAEDAALADQVTRHGAAFVDITASVEYTSAVERLKPSAPILLSVGLAPGLTNLLAAAVQHEAPAQPIDIALLLGAGERYGKASTAWAYQLLGQDFADPATGERIRNYSRPRRFHLPVYGVRRLLRVDYSDQHVLHRDLGVPVRTYFGLTSRLATAALAVLTRLPAAAHAAPSWHLPGDQRWLALARSADGRTHTLGGRVQAHATAAIAAIAALKAAHLPRGVHHLHHVLDLSDLAALPIRLHPWYPPTPEPNH